MKAFYGVHLGSPGYIWSKWGEAAAKGNSLIQNASNRIIKAFCDQSDLFSIRQVTIYDLMIVLFQLVNRTIRIIKPCFNIRAM